MTSKRVKVGIVGLGRWAKVLTRASLQSEAIEIVAGYSRSEEKRAAFRDEFGIAVTPDLATMLADRAIEGVILTVPNEQHLPLAREVAKAGKHVYTEKPIAHTLEDGLEIEALEKTFGVTVTVGHSARLMAGIRRMREAIDAGELGRVGFIEANFSNERALELTPEDVALVQGQGARRPTLAARDPPFRCRCIILAARSSKRRRWRRSSRRSAPRSTTSR